MNTFENLIENGIDKHTAVSMLDSYASKIGTMNGVYKITDITYDFKERGRDVELKCTLCGRKIHRIMVKGRNKWSEIIKTCPCQKEKKLQEQMAISENLKIQKRSMIESRIGDTYGDYTIISVEDIDGRNPRYVMKCNECGFEKIVSANCFEKLDFKCHKHFNPIKYDDSYIGRKYNYLEIIGFDYDSNNHRMAKCRCDCGNVKLIVATNVVDGTVKSCGCMHDDLLKTHGLSKSRLYRIWRGMNDRCFNEKSHAYSNYGGRGITICDEWIGEQGLLCFIDWANQNGYSDDLSIDRINVNGNYEPSNCRWADDETQLENRRPRSEWKKREYKNKRKRRVIWTIDGITKPARDWCDECGVSYEMAMYRINHMGMSVYEALTTPKITKGRNRKACNA